MRYEYQPEGGEAGVQIILRAGSSEDLRFLTMLREYLSGRGLRLRVTGSEHSDVVVPGCLPKPALALSVTLEHADGRPYIPSPGEVLDPNKFVRAPKK
jgi:hypothetical protein